MSQLKLKPVRRKNGGMRRMDFEFLQMAGWLSDQTGDLLLIAKVIFRGCSLSNRRSVFDASECQPGLGSLWHNPICKSRGG